MKVLWLASWYPNQLDKFTGDFIQRHARATALFSDIEVIHIVKDAKGVVTKNVKEIVASTGRVTEKIIYYKPVKTYVRIIDRFLSSVQYKKLYKQAVKKYIVQNGTPSFIHVHIAMKAGLTALWLKRRYKIPYLLTEHWGGYLDEAVPNIKDYNVVYKYYWSKIITGAKVCTFVSTTFQNFMFGKYKIKNSLVIPNVVNTAVFYPGEKLPSNSHRFIHIFTMIYQKNTKAILEAMAILKNSESFELYLYGPVNSSIESLIIKLELQHHVFVKEEVSQEVLSEAIQQSDALILYSRFETFGCVLIEANACGVPVIVSELEVFHELIEEGVNGIFVKGENPVALAEKIKSFIAQKNDFNKNAIAASAAEKYNYNRVGKQFIELYEQVLLKRQ